MTILKLVLMAILPPALSVALCSLERKTSFGNWKNKSIIAGLVFGAAAVFCTEFGVNTGFAIYNTRDASVICAGIFFGWKASAVAALIGSVERFLTPLWGKGAYTRLACSIATACAGLFVSLLVKYVVKRKTPRWNQGFAMGLFIESFHMLLIFVTHPEDLHMAFIVVRECSHLMIMMNASSVCLAILCNDLICYGKLKHEELKSVSVQLVHGIAIAMTIAFGLSVLFTKNIQKKLSISDTTNILISNIRDVENEIIYRLDIAKVPKNAIENVTSFRHVGQSGYIVITNSEGKIISDLKDSEYIGLSDLGLNSDTSNEMVLMKGLVKGVKSYYLYENFYGYTIFAVMTVEEAEFSKKLSVYVSIFMELLIFAFLFVMLWALMRLLVLKNVDKINTDLQKITEGELDIELENKPNREFQSISSSINKTVDKLKTLIDEANERIDKELEMAKKIQSESLPSVFPPYPNRSDIDLFASMQTAKQVGGDFYDFFFIRQNKLAFLVADVSGKGIPAALFMMKAKTLIRNLTITDLDIPEIVYRANNSLCENNEAGMFVTAWIGCLDTETGVLEYCNAGHNPPVLIDNDGKITSLRDISGLVLAGLPDMKYRKFSLQLKPKDKLFLYTDGVTEATDSCLKMYSEKRLLELLSDSGVRLEKPQAVCKRVMKSLDNFTAKAEQFDDITMLCLEYSGKS